MSIIRLVGAPGTVNSASGGKMWSTNALSTTPETVIAANASRTKITFHNPGTVDAYVAPAVNYNGAALTVGVGTLGGTFLVFANGGTLTIEGECQTAWQAFSASGSGNPLTIMDSNL